MAYLHIKGFQKTFGNAHIIKGVDLTIQQGEFIVFVGPSGCGKSTLLRLIAGLENISEGSLVLDGRDITHAPSAKRDLAMVFQSYALYPHMSVFDNMSFALKLAGVSPTVIAEKVNRAAGILNLSAYLAHTPKQLSGGQRQRVAIGRAIVRNPKIFLFDEPLSNLDAALRGQTRVEIAKLHRDLGATTIYVTHDQIEAMTLADRVVVLRDGKIEQVGSPLELYDHPANTFVAGFIGTPQMNLLHADISADIAQKCGLALPLGGSIGLRPEALSVQPVAAGCPLQGSIELIEALGAETLVYVKINSTQADQAGPTLVVRQTARSSLQLGDTVGLTIQGNLAHIFDSQGQACVAIRA